MIYTYITIQPDDPMKINHDKSPHPAFFFARKPRWPPGGGASEGDGGVEQLRVALQREVRTLSSSGRWSHKIGEFSWEKWENMMIEYYDW